MAGDARATLIAELREHALVIGEVTLTSGRTAQYYVDAKRAILLPDGFNALAELIAAEAKSVAAKYAMVLPVGLRGQAVKSLPPMTKESLNRSAPL